MRELFGEKYYSIKECAELLQLEIDTLRRWCAKGKWKDKAKKIGGEWWVPEFVIRELIAPPA